MKKSLIFLACLAATLALTGIVLAQTIPAGEAVQGKSQVPTKKRVLGTVMSVDTVADVIVVRSKDAIITFEVNGSTKIMVDGKSSKLGDVPTDSKITLLYTRHGNKKLAVWLMVERRQPQIGKQVTRPLKSE